MWFCVSFFFSLFPSSSSRKKREKKSLYAYSFVVVHVVATVYNTLRRDRSNDNHTQVSLSRRGAKTAEKRRRRRRRRRRSRSKKIHELIDSKGFEPRSNKTPGRDFSRSWSTRIRCDKPTFRTPALHFSPLRCVLFWFTRRFPGVFFYDFLNARDVIQKRDWSNEWRGRNSSLVKVHITTFIIWRVRHFDSST